MSGNLVHSQQRQGRSSIATAQWLDPHIVARNYAYREGDFWLGRSLDEFHESIGYNDDRHVCLCSSSRGGKGTAFIINNLCLWPGSCVIVDPKGENATVTARRRGAGSDYAEGMGQKVYVLDPFNITDLPDDYKSCFNPLDAIDIHNEEAIDEATRLADAIVVSGQSSEPFWDEAARALIKGIILHILTEDDYEGRRDLTTLRMLITRGDWESVQLLRDAGEQNVPSAHKFLLASMRRNEAFGGVIAGFGETYGSMADNSEKTFDSVLQTAITNTEFLDSPGLRKCLSSSDFRLSDLKTDPKGITLYLTLPQRFMNTHFRWLRMMVAMTITEMEKVRQRPASGHRILLLLDEFAGLQRMQIVENAVAQMAGFGVKMVYILQTLSQLKSTYKDNWETFLGNASLKVFFNLDDSFSRDYVSKFIGETEVVRQMRSESQSRSESESDTEGSSDSISESRSESRSQNRSRGYSVSTSRGGSSGGSFSSSGAGFSSGSSYGSNWSRSRSDSYNEGSSETYGTTSGTTRGTSRSKTRGTSRSETEGMSESLFKTALISPDELGKFFSRIDDKNNPDYPGLSLVLIAGQSPIVLRKCNYYEDDYFSGCFDPHPDHEKPRPNIAYWDIHNPDAAILRIYINKDKLGQLTMYKWRKREGEAVKKGEVIFEAGPVVEHQEVFDWYLENDLIPDDESYKSRVLFLSPVSGTLSMAAVNENQDIPPDDLIATLAYSRRTAMLERDIEVPDMFAVIKDLTYEKEEKGKLLQKKALHYGFIVIGVLSIILARMGAFGPDNLMNKVFALIGTALIIYLVYLYVFPLIDTVMDKLGKGIRNRLPF